MTLVPRATEIAALVARLGSRDAARVDAARARLATLGGSAIEPLIESIDREDGRARIHAIDLLGMIGDPRGRDPLVATLLDRDSRSREAAARSLGRFPAPAVVGALERLIDRENLLAVRVAAIEALCEQFANGQESALRRLLTVLLDSRLDRRLRIAAAPVLSTMRRSERRGLLRRLRQDGCREFAEHVARLETARDRPPSPAVLLRQLGHPNYAIWNRALRGLVALGPASVRPALRAMRRRSYDPEYCTRVGMVLKALGPRRGRAIVEGLDRVREAFPLQVLVETIGSFGEKALVYRLAGLIDRLSTIRRRRPSGDFEAFQRARAKAHLELARVGSRLAIADLRDALADEERRVESEILVAAGQVGTRAELPALLGAWRREDRETRNRIAEATRSILRREGLRRDSRAFAAWSADLRRTLRLALSKATRVKKR